MLGNDSVCRKLGDCFVVFGLSAGEKSYFFPKELLYDLNNISRLLVASERKFFSLFFAFRKNANFLKFDSIVEQFKA